MNVGKEPSRTKIPLNLGEMTFNSGLSFISTSETANIYKIDFVSQENCTIHFTTQHSQRFSRHGCDSRQRVDVSEETNHQAYCTGADWIRGRENARVGQKAHPSLPKQAIPKVLCVPEVLESQ